MRHLVRIASLALCATALTACSMIGDEDSSVVTPPARPSLASASGLDVTSNVRQAQLLRTNGDLNGAMMVLSQLMLAAPDDPRVVGEYGKLLVQQGRTGDAVQFLRRAVELQTNDWTLYSALGVAYDQMSDQANARLAYERALMLKPNEPAVLNNYAMSRMLAGDTQTARALLARAQATGSTDPKIASNVALLDRMAPVPAAVAPAAPVAPRTGVASNTGFPPVPPHPVTTAPMPPAAAASNTPRPLTTASATPGAAPRQIMMQEVPVDPLAGPVHGKPAKPAKPSKLAKDDKAKPAKPGKPEKPTRLAKSDKPKPEKPAKAAPPTRTAAAAPPAKPVKPSKPNAIPALRMTADAGKP